MSYMCYAMVQFANQMNVYDPMFNVDDAVVDDDATLHAARSTNLTRNEHKHNHQIGTHKRRGRARFDGHSVHGFECPVRDSWHEHEAVER